jgi:hypothetical protein
MLITEKWYAQEAVKTIEEAIAIYDMNVDGYIDSPLFMEDNKVMVYRTTSVENVMDDALYRQPVTTKVAYLGEPDDVLQD